jgi:hypothetical protein
MQSKPEGFICEVHTPRHIDDGRRSHPDPFVSAGQALPEAHQRDEGHQGAVPEGT